jgi:hypothetical protein
MSRFEVKRPSVLSPSWLREHRDVLPYEGFQAR